MSTVLLGFTAHLVNNDFHRRSAVLHAWELSERHRRVYCYEDNKNAGRVEYTFISGSYCYQSNMVKELYQKQSF